MNPKIDLSFIVKQEEEGHALLLNLHATSNAIEEVNRKSLFIVLTVVDYQRLMRASKLELDYASSSKPQTFMGLSLLSVLNRPQSFIVDSTGNEWML